MCTGGNAVNNTVQVARAKTDYRRIRVRRWLGLRRPRCQIAAERNRGPCACAAMHDRDYPYETAMDVARTRARCGVGQITGERRDPGEGPVARRKGGGGAGGVVAVRPALLVLPARARAVDANRAEEVDDLAVQEELDRVVACVPCMTEIYLHIYMFDARMTYDVPLDGVPP